jgi:ArsR family transcriptional regulator
VAHPLPDELVELIAARFRALAEPTRIKLLDRLREGEASVLELTALTGASHQNASKHLVLLQQAGIVVRRKQGNYAYYRIADETVFDLCEAVCGSLHSRFDALRKTAGARGG